MRVLLSAYDSRGGVEPLAALAVHLRALGVELLAAVGVPLLPFGESLRAMKTGAMPSEEDLRRHLTG
jgi:vancomycin aglycone glucosyltransferase